MLLVGNKAYPTTKPAQKMSAFTCLRGMTSRVCEQWQTILTIAQNCGCHQLARGIIGQFGRFPKLLNFYLDRVVRKANSKHSRFCKNRYLQHLHIYALVFSKQACERFELDFRVFSEADNVFRISHHHPGRCFRPFTVNNKNQRKFWEQSRSTLNRGESKG